MVYWLASFAITWCLIGLMIVFHEERLNLKVWLSDPTDATILIVWTLFVMVFWPILLLIEKAIRDINWQNDYGEWCDAEVTHGDAE